MARYVTPTDPTALAPSRNTEQRAPQFVGGSVDPTTGNLVPGSRDDAANGRAAAVAQDIAATPEPAAPTTRLATATPDAPGIDYGAVVQNAALNAGVGLAAKGVGDTLGKAIGFGTGNNAGTSPLATPNPGGDIGLTGTPSTAGTSFPANDTFGPFDPSPINIGTPANDVPANTGFNGYYGGPGDAGGTQLEGGSVLCTYFRMKGKISDQLYAAEWQYVGANISHETRRGYRAWAVPLVRIMQQGGKRGERLERFLWPIVNAAVRHLCYRAGALDRRNIGGQALLAVGVPVCWCIGLFAGDTDFKALWAK